MSFDYDGALERAKKKWLVSAGVTLEGDAISYADGFTDTGRLRGSITYQTKNEGSQVRSPANGGDKISKPRDDDTVTVGSNVEYAPYLEYGTKYQRAQPYLRPAIDGRRSDVTRMFRDTLKDEYKKEARHDR
jgi:HK97 gp10 family phage protein